jgi:hypothetical protein
MPPRLALILPLLLLPAAHAQPVATAPAGAAHARPDLSSPKATLTTLYTALRAGDIAAAKACMLFADARQAELLDLSLTQVWGPLKLMHAMEARFGEPGRRPFANATQEKAADALLERIRQADVTVTGDTAAVAQKKAAVNPSAENELTGVTLKKDDGGWKVVAATFSDAASDVPASQLQMMRRLHEASLAASATTLDRLARGEFATADEAFAAYQARLQQGAAAAGAAATQPKSP